MPQADPWWRALVSQASSHGRTLGGLVQLEGRVGQPQALLQGRALAPHTPLESRVLAAQGAVTVQEGEKPQVLFQGHSEF